MKVSTLIEKLEKIKKEKGDLEVWIQACYFGGDYGEYNEVQEGPVIYDPNVGVNKITIWADAH